VDQREGGSAGISKKEQRLVLYLAAYGMGEQTQGIVTAPKPDTVYAEGKVALEINTPYGLIPAGRSRCICVPY